MYLLLGAGGFLGSYVIRHILEDTDDSVIAVSRNGQTVRSESPRTEQLTCDLCGDKTELYKRLSSVDGLKVIYLAARHNIDLVAQEPDEAYKLNVTALKDFMEHAGRVRCLFFASSDTVYGEGGTHVFKETDSLSPISVYARQKLEGEQIVLSHGGNVLRLPFMFGRSLSPYKKHFCDMLEEKFSRGESADMFTDSIRSALSFDTVAGIFVKLSESCGSDMPRVMNVAGDEALSKYSIGVRLAESIGADTALAVPAESAGKWQPGAQRAVSTLMDNTLLKRQLKTDRLTFNII